MPHPPRRGLSGRVGLSLLTACFAQVPPKVCQITVRADAGFFSRKVVEAVEARQGNVVIVAQLTRPLRRQIPSCGTPKFGEDSRLPNVATNPWLVPILSLRCRAQDLARIEKPAHKVVHRRRYSYRAFVTNFRAQPLTVYRFYNDRAALELIIKELKADYPLAKIPTVQFAANEAYFHLLLLPASR